MKRVKKTDEYEIFAKRSERYAVKNNNKQWVNGEDKVKILLAEGLIKAPEPKAETPAEEPAAEEVSAAEDAAAEGEASAEE